MSAARPQILTAPQRIPTGPSGPIPITDPRVANLLQRKDSDLQRLNGECASLQARLAHFTGIMICILQHHFNGGPITVPFELLNKVAPDLGINTEQESTTQEVKISIMSAEEFQLANAGMVSIEADVVVPKRSPFTVTPKLPPGATFMGLMEANYKGGKSDGKPLDILIGQKPKKPRECMVDKDCLRFTTDSAGMQVHIKFAAKLKQEDPEPDVDDSPLTCKGEFHRDKDAPGVRCILCGDSRKLPELSAQA